MRDVPKYLLPPPNETVEYESISPLKTMPLLHCKTTDPSDVHRLRPTNNAELDSHAGKNRRGYNSGGQRLINIIPYPSVRQSRYMDKVSTA